MLRWCELHAVILERNKLVGRKVARLFLSVGATAVTVEEPKHVAAAIAEKPADVLCADTFDGDFVAEQVRMLDPLNPQLAATLAGAFNLWKRHRGPRRALMQKCLQRIVRTRTLSPDVTEVVTRALSS